MRALINEAASLVPGIIVKSYHGTADLDRDRVALDLARDRRAPVLVQSTLASDTACLPPVAGVRLSSRPPTTSPLNSAWTKRRNGSSNRKNEMSRPKTGSVTAAVAEYGTRFCQSRTVSQAEASEPATPRATKTASPPSTQPTIGVKTGIAVLTDNPREVGADRICNAVAAHHLFPKEPCVVVDFGTAIKVEAITAKGEFAGGVIAPGMDVAATALFAAAARLTRVEFTAPASTIGKSTVTALQSGIIFGTAGLVDGLVTRVIDELGGEARVIATGGLASAVREHCETIERVEPTLTLLGLPLIFERNVESV